MYKMCVNSSVICEYMAFYSNLNMNELTKTIEVSKDYKYEFNNDTCNIRSLQLYCKYNMIFFDTESKRMTNVSTAVNTIQLITLLLIADFLRAS